MVTIVLNWKTQMMSLLIGQFGHSVVAVLIYYWLPYLTMWSLHNSAPLWQTEQPKTDNFNEIVSIQNKEFLVTM